MLEIQHLDVSYGQYQVVWDVSLHVDKGEMVAILGPNGAGKSTLLSAVAGLIRSGPKSRIVYNDKEIQNKSSEKIVNDGMALVPQGGRLFLLMDVKSNLEMGAYTKKARADISDSLKLVYGLFPVLEKRAHQLCRTLSGGERQMVALGRALMSRPDLLLLDEVSSGLAPIVTERIFEGLVELNKKGLTILIAEQNIANSLKITSRAYILAEGRIALERKSAALVADHEVVGKYLGVNF